MLQLYEIVGLGIGQVVACMALYQAFASFNPMATICLLQLSFNYQLLNRQSKPKMMLDFVVIVHNHMVLMRKLIYMVPKDIIMSNKVHNKYKW